MTLIESINGGQDLLVTITMPFIEVGTIGGGAVLAPQQSVLEMPVLVMKRAHPTHPVEILRLGFMYYYFLILNTILYI
jgi:hydroxymethylglutaryl-CoA reductase (NADPH)